MVIVGGGWGVGLKTLGVGRGKTHKKRGKGCPLPRLNYACVGEPLPHSMVWSEREA